jgi:hypothetical protein
VRRPENRPVGPYGGFCASLGGGENTETPCTGKKSAVTSAAATSPGRASPDAPRSSHLLRPVHERVNVSTITPIRPSNSMSIFQVASYWKAFLTINSNRISLFRPLEASAPPTTIVKVGDTAGGRRHETRRSCCRLARAALSPTQQSRAGHSNQIGSLCCC